MDLWLFHKITHNYAIPTQNDTWNAAKKMQNFADFCIAPDKVNATEASTQICPDMRRYMINWNMAIKFHY